MRKYLVTVVMGLALMMVAFMLTGCGSSSTSRDEYETIMLTQDGFDFSAGMVSVDASSNDGDIVGWAPNPSSYNYSAGSAIWYRSAANTASINYTRDMGAVAMGSVLNAPITWDGGADVDLPPLEEGHVYVAKCLDGYVKFKVISLDTLDWKAEVEYYYSHDTMFTH